MTNQTKHQTEIEVMSAIAEVTILQNENKDLREENERLTSWMNFWKESSGDWRTACTFWRELSERHAVRINELQAELAKTEDTLRMMEEALKDLHKSLEEEKEAYNVTADQLARARGQ